MGEIGKFLERIRIGRGAEEESEQGIPARANEDRIFDLSTDVCIDADRTFYKNRFLSMDKQLPFKMIIQ